MFFLRCAFFLSIVYVSISFGAGSMHSPHAFEAAIASEASGVAATVVARATDWCVERPGQCSRDAARLTALVQMTTAEPAVAGEDVVEVEAPKAPLRMPAPRRRATRAVLTTVP